MTAEDRYISEVVNRLPATRLRSNVAMELRGHIAERVEHGQSLDEALRQLGDPVALAESYLAAVPLVAGTFWERAGAKLIDLLAVLCIVGPTSLAAAWLLDLDMFVMGAIGVSIGATVLFGGYTALTEWVAGQTLGKRAMGLRVVRESGARISLGQAIVRQLPIWFQVFWLDVLFALFTDRSQRAFELLSKTRVVDAEEEMS